MANTDEFRSRLHAVATELRKISTEYATMKFTASEEAMSWPLSVLADEDGTVAIWCNKEDCLLDGHNSLVYEDPENLTVAGLLCALIDHIDHNYERLAEQGK